MSSTNKVSPSLDINNIITLHNIKLLQPPISTNCTTLKIICDTSIRSILNKIRTITGDNNIYVKFDDDKGCDYYDLVLNKRINGLEEQMNEYNVYNLDVRYSKEGWILKSIEIVDMDEYSDVEDSDIVDYEEIKNDILRQILIKINKLNSQIEKKNQKINKYKELKETITDRFNQNNIEEYYNLLN